MTRTWVGSERNPGGNGSPKLTNSRPRFAARPSNVTSTPVARGILKNASEANAVFPASRNAKAFCTNDLRESFESDMFGVRGLVTALVWLWLLVATHELW